jgi:fibro-slime domain-containing protein/LPXTG-motif cell wall-anchored protein
VSYDFLNHGINNGHPLKFWGSGIGNNYGSANQYQEHGVTSIVQRNLVGGVGGYPQITANSNPDHSMESLAYLFTPSNGTDKEAYTNVNHLFKREGDYYVYDSNSNYAYYDKNQGSGGNFVVYDRTYKQKSGSDSGSIQDKAIGFFPFHKWNEDYDLYVNWNKNLNHHFGMSMSVPFSLPKDPKAVKDSTGQPIIFEFSGDDDLWVFIDGKLAMDIGGIHQPTNGTINFMTGEVIVNGARQNGFNFNGLYDGKMHTLQVFYIERGGCDSNCMIKFNMTQYGNVEFDKVDADDNSLLAGAVFGLYKDDRCTIPLTEELKTGGRRAFIVETDANGHAKLEDVPLGDYYLKEIHAPDGYPIAIGDGTVRVRVYLDSNGNVKTSINGEETDAKILNRKPAKINLGLKKEWQNTNGQPITAPYGVTATFEIKRIRTYETYTEREVQGHGEDSSHLTVGWIHNNVPHIYEEFDLIAGTQATVSWDLATGYTGKIGCLIDGTEYTKSPNPNNIYSQGLTMPAAGQTTVLYIIDESENGDAIKNINVAGSQFYGNSGGGFIHEFHTITEPDPDFTYTDTAVSNNQVTLPINESTWQYTFSNLPSLGTGMVTVEGKQQKVTYKYSYYLEEVSSTAPEGTTVIYKDLNGNVINSTTDAETSTSGTETIINKVVEQDLALKKVGVNNTDPNLTQNPVGGAKFTIYHATGANKDQKGAVVQIAADQKLENLVSADVTGLFWSGKLLAGDYIIEEVEAPLGYVKVSGLIRMTVTKDGVNLSYIGTTGTPPYNQPKKEGNTWAITIINTAGASLPNTGGFGTKPFTIGGMMLVLMSLMLYCIGGRRRTLAEEFSIRAGGSAGRKGGDPRL